MLAVVDTNHLSELDRDSAFAARFRERQQSARADVFTTIVTIQEVAKGWLGLLNRIPKASG